MSQVKVSGRERLQSVKTEVTRRWSREDEGRVNRETESGTNY